MSRLIPKVVTHRSRFSIFFPVRFHLPFFRIQEDKASYKIKLKVCCCSGNYNTLYKLQSKVYKLISLCLRYGISSVDILWMFVSSDAADKAIRIKLSKYSSY